MKLKQENYDVGVIVGRFQVPDLHHAHSQLIQSVCDEHDKVLIFLGLSPVMVTRENPLDYESRKQMILDAFPHVNMFYIKDRNDDRLWSAQLDEMIKDVITPAQSVVLYGGRDSFIERYHGRFPTRELEQDVWVSGNAIRQRVSRRSVRQSADFRSGVVWAAYGRFPVCYPTVDIAIFSGDEQRLLLGRKPFESKYRLIGGFAEPESDSYERDAIREVREETGISISPPQYVGSFKIDDWRYRGEADKIKTLLFKANHLFGAPRPGDDIAEVRWFELDKLDLRDVMPNHHPLIEAVLANPKL